MPPIACSTLTRTLDLTPLHRSMLTLGAQIAVYACHFIILSDNLP